MVSTIPPSHLLNVLELFLYVVDGKVRLGLGWVKGRLGVD